MPSCDFTSGDVFSSPTMSMQSSTHSSQMNTVGPAMSLRTSCWLLPQNVQWSLFLVSPPLTLIISEPRLDARRQCMPLGQTTDMLLLRSSSALRRCRLFGPRIPASPNLGHLRAVRSAYAVGNPRLRLSPTG